ncbi:MAG: sigma-70 family RNA polymerase sigma factor [Candidatus Gracilibacteria bacterium]|jgi:RNA polymerase sigma-70 factor (ECF subfamily)
MSLSASSNFDIDAAVLAAQEGDKDAFAQLYDRFFEPIYRYVYFRVAASEVDDLVEIVFIKAWMNLEKYEKRDVNFSAWLFKIAHNAVIDHRRSHRPLFEVKEEIADESDKSAPKELTEKNMLSQTIRLAVDELKEPYKQVVTLKFLLGLSNPEIAEIMNEREGNIRVIQFRALKELKGILNKKGLEQESL